MMCVSFLKNSVDPCIFNVFVLLRYLAEQVPFAEGDVEAGVRAKFKDLVADAGTAALRVLLLQHSMELKHERVESQLKDATEDVDKWKHKCNGFEARLKDALKEKKAAEKELGEMKEARDAAVKEKDERKVEGAKLQEALDAAKEEVEAGKRALALYFDSGFKRAKEQVLLFNPEAKMDDLDPFKVVVNGELVDDE